MNRYEANKVQIADLYERDPSLAAELAQELKDQDREEADEIMFGGIE